MAAFTIALYTQFGLLHATLMSTQPPWLILTIQVYTVSVAQSAVSSVDRLAVASTRRKPWNMRSQQTPRRRGG